MLKRRSTWIILTLLLVAVIAGGYYYFNGGLTPAASQPDQTAEVQTTVARRGDITVSATGAGSVIPAQEVSLSFVTGGMLTELLVQVGDKVAAGDVLARVDDSAAQESLASARLQLAQVTMQTDGSATRTGISFNDISVEQARLNLEVAQGALDDLLNFEPDPDEVALLESQLRAAQAGLQSAQGQAASASYSVQSAEINLEQAKRDLATAQENYDNAWGEGRDWETFYDQPICDPGEQEPCTGQTWADRIERDRESTASALLRAQENLTLVQASYNATVATSGTSTASAQSGILSAQQALAAAESGPTDSEIEAARRAVHQAELSLQQALLNQESSLISLESSQLSVAAAVEAVTGTALIAPIDGVVTAINASVGEQAPAAVIVLADLGQPTVEVYLDESDLSMVGLGYQVDVVFDAFPDETFNGKVEQIDPQLSNVNGVTAVRALVRLDEASFAKPQTLPIGLNATVEVVAGQTTNAVLVPVEALREISSGQYAVFVMENGEPRLRQVEVGLMDFSFAEILSGLDAGEEITTGLIATQ